VLMHDTWGLQLPLYFTIVSFLAVMAGLIALAFVPSHKEMQRISRAVITFRTPSGTATEDPGYGSTASPQTPAYVSEEPLANPTFVDTLNKSWSALKESTSLFCRVHPGISALFFGYSMFQYMFSVYPSFEMYPLYVKLLGVARADTLVHIFGGLYSCVGALFLVTFGKLVDQVGLAQAIFWLNVPTVMNAYLFTVPSMFAQVSGQVLLACMTNAWYVFLPLFCSVYGPPELFGAMYGIFSALLGFGQIVCTRFGTLVTLTIVDAFYHGSTTIWVPPPGFKILTTIHVWCFLQVVASFALLLWWYYFSIPEPGTTTIAHVRNAGSTSSQENASGAKLLIGGTGKDTASVPSFASDTVTARKAMVARSSSSTCFSCLPPFGGRLERGMP